MNVRLSVDIGGTFTDVVLARDDVLVTSKVLTTYSDPAAGVMAGIEQVLSLASLEAAQVGLVLHGTTLATNALIERRGAPTALLTTQGHRDALEMALENRFEQYDVNIDRPQPLVPRHWRLGVRERVAADGTVLLDLDEAGVVQQLEILVAQGVQSLAVGLLHSYANAQHEQRIAALVKRSHPDLALTLSSDVCPEIREYERLSTTVANAYVKPLMDQYLASLEAQLQARGITAQVLLMTSGGGLTTLQAARAYPIRLVESGPAGGAMLAANMARQCELSRVLSFDMGGTTAKICLIEDGQPQHSRAFEVDRSYRFKRGSGLPVRIPVIEMVEIGAGGGSIAALDALRRIGVGPASAGSEPGPVCYDRGGTQPTVTDADAVLGKLSPTWFGGGQLSLQVPQAKQVLLDALAAPLALSVEDGAHAVCEIVEENMAAAARAHASEWGRDLGGRCMIAFGGAAPLHAAALARKLKIDQVLIPAGAGVGSAVGFLLAPIRFEVVRSRYARLTDLQQPVVEALFADMRREAASVLAGAGVHTGVMERREAYMRYVGQGYEVAVAVADLQGLRAETLQRDFEAVYRRLYGRTIPGMPIEILSWTLSLSETVRAPQQAAVPSVVDLADLPATVSLYDQGQWVTANVCARHRLAVDETHPGPILVVEEQTTTVVPVDFSVTHLPDGSLSLQRVGARSDA